MKKRGFIGFVVVVLIFLIVMATLTSIEIPQSPAGQDPEEPPEEISADVPPPPPPPPSDSPEPPPTTGEEDNVTIEPDETEEADDPPVDIPPQIPVFEPYSVEGTEPELMIASTSIMADRQIVDSYNATEPIDFSYSDEYSEIEGITAFRGNNFRDSASYGFANINNARFGNNWTQATGNLVAPDEAYWSGHGWTGQPLIVRWPKRTREIMNMYDWAKEQDELVEIVYAAMDGYVYFNELETGKPTRDKLFLGFTFKGSGSLDPRGYPLLYVGAGYDSARGESRIFIVSLIDGSVLYTFGQSDGFAPRAWPAADASPLIDANTDTLIYPSENGVIYLIKLNSEFDPEAGTMTIEPADPVKWCFFGKRSHTAGKYWLGFEDSPVIWRGHLIIADNGGHLICLNLNTLELAWVQDVMDDTNCSPVMRLEDGHPYIYISTSFHGGWRASGGSSAAVPIWKIDAVTGEIVWQTDYECYTSSDASGGVQGTAALGQNDLDGLVYFPIGRTPNGGTGILAALDIYTGEVVWEFQTNSYSWSSPVCVYNQAGKGYIIHCTANGNMYLLDGLSGQMLDSIQLGGLIEASPAVYENTVVLGTRVMRIWGIELT